MTKEIFNYLVMHIHDMQKNKIRIISRYSMDYEKYTAALDMLNGYIHCVEDCVNRDLISDGEHRAPMVIIGSTVCVKDNSGSAQTFTITTPGTNTGAASDAVKAVSCFGSVGRALLLKKQGEPFELGGKAAGVIDDIQYEMKL